MEHMIRNQEIILARTDTLLIVVVVAWIIAVLKLGIVVVMTAVQMTRQTARHLEMLKAVDRTVRDRDEIVEALKLIKEWAQLSHAADRAVLNEVKTLPTAVAAIAAASSVANDGSATNLPSVQRQPA